MYLPVKLLSEFAILPTRAHPGDAGLDLASSATLTIFPGGTDAIPTGLALGIPEGFCGLVMGRSGMASRGQLVAREWILGGGLIDQPYTGEIKVIVHNAGPEPFRIVPGTRVGQLVILPFLAATPVEVEDLEPTARGVAGLGSTGI